MTTVRLTDKDIIEFKALYKQHFGEDLEWNDAYDKALKLVTMMKHVYQPITAEQYEAVMKVNLKQDK